MFVPVVFSRSVNMSTPIVCDVSKTNLFYSQLKRSLSDSLRDSAAVGLSRFVGYCRRYVPA